MRFCILIELDLKYEQCKLGEFKLLVQLDMQDLFTGQTLVTFGYHRPTGDIITKLKATIDMDIETLYQVIAEQPGRGHTMCMTATRL